MSESICPKGCQGPGDVTTLARKLMPSTTPEFSKLGN